MHQATQQSLLAPRRSPFAGFLVLSVVGHGVLLGLGLVASWVLAGPRLDLDPKPIKASLVRLGKKRDEKLLPRLEAEAPPPPKTVPVPSPTPVKPEPKPASKPEVKPDQKRSLFDAFKKTGAQAKPEELEGDPEGDAEGDSAVQEGERYYGLLKAVVRRYYDVSNTIPEAERIRLRAEVHVRIGANGELVDVELSKGSGNDVFDGAVIGAVKKAAPFAPPPQNLRDTLKKGIVMGFTP